VGIKVRFADFKTVSRVRTVPEPVDLAATLYAEALALYAGLDLDRPRIRLLGVKAEGLIDAGSVSQQLSFDDLEVPRATSVSAAGPSGGRGSAEQLSRDPAPLDQTVNPGRLSAVERVADLARHRFGSAAVRKASLIEPGRMGRRRRGVNRARGRR
jgi:DNA polymerase-4